MVIVPRERPVMAGLNSFYLDIERLLEHFQGEIGAGGLHFISPNAEAVFFFDQDDLLGGAYRGREGAITGKGAWLRMLEVSRTGNFAVEIYQIHPANVHFWANTPSGQVIYRDLSTEFTDLDGLIRKMASEKLTGYIDVVIGKGMEGGIVFFSGGEIVGGSYSWGEGTMNDAAENLDVMIQRTKASGGVFHVIRIPRDPGAGGHDAPAARAPSPRELKRLAALLNDVERLHAQSKIKPDFRLTLRGKFMEKADTYPFLDPFEAEFEYADGRITFTGKAAFEELSEAVITCAREMATETGMLASFQTLLEAWLSDHEAGQRGPAM
jgi:hypothetical protein